MSKVHHLHVVEPGKRDVREDTIAVLKAALDAAKKGEIVECVIIARYPTDTADGTRWREMASGTTHFCEWIGRLEILKSGWIDQYRDLTEELSTDVVGEEDDEDADLGETDFD